MLEEGICLFRKFIGKADDLIESESSDGHHHHQHHHQLELVKSNNNRPEGFGNTTYHDGDYFRANGATMAKPNINIPITIAAKSKRMLQIAAKYSDFG